MPQDVAFVQFVRQRRGVDQGRGRDERCVEHDLFQRFDSRRCRRVLTRPDAVMFQTSGCSQSEDGGSFRVLEDGDPGVLSRVLLLFDLEAAGRRFVFFGPPECQGVAISLYTGLLHC